MDAVLPDFPMFQSKRVSERVTEQVQKKQRDNNTERATNVNAEALTSEGNPVYLLKASFPNWSMHSDMQTAHQLLMIQHKDTSIIMKEHQQLRTLSYLRQQAQVIHPHQLSHAEGSKSFEDHDLGNIIRDVASLLERNWTVTVFLATRV